MAGSVYNIQVRADTAQAQAGLQGVQRELAITNQKAAAVGRGLKILGGLFAAEHLIRELKELSDAFLKVKNNLSIAGQGGDQFNRSFERLYEISQKTRTPLEGNSDLMRQLALSARDTGASIDEMYQLTENAATGLALLGTTGQRATAATIQLAHALSEGVVKARQWNSLLIDNPALLHAMAQATNQSLGQIRRDIIAGTKTSREFKEELLKAGEVLQTWWARAVPTISQAFTTLENAAIKAVGSLEQNVNALSAVAYAIIGLGNTLQYVLPLLVNFGIAFGIGRIAIFAQEMITAQRAVALFGVAQQAALIPLQRWLFILAAIVTGLTYFGQTEIQIGNTTVTLSQAVKNLVGSFFALLGSITQLSPGWQALIGGMWAVGGALLLLTGRFKLLGLALSVVGTAFVALNIPVQYAGYAVAGLSLAYLLLRTRILQVIATGISSFLYSLGQLSIAVTSAASAMALALTGVDIALAPMAALIAAVLIVIGALGFAILKVTGYWEDFKKSVGDIASTAVEKLGDTIAGIAEHIGEIVKRQDDWTDSAENTVGAIEDTNSALDDTVAKLKEATDLQNKLKKDSKGGAPGSLSASLTVNEGDKSVSAGGTGSAAILGSGNSVSISNVGNSNNSSGDLSGGGGGGGGGATRGTYELSHVAEIPTFRQVRTGGYEVAQVPQTFYGFQGGPEGIATLLNNGTLQKAADEALARYQPIWQAMLQVMQAQLQATGKWGGLNARDTQLIKLQTGATQEDINKVVKDNQQAIRLQKQIFQLQQQQQRDLQRAQEREQRRQQAEAARQQAIQARNQGIEQTLLTALNNLQVSSVGGLPPEVRAIANSIGNLQKKLALTTDPIRRAELGRQVQVLNDRLQELTGGVNGLNDTLNGENPYLAYAQNVYEKLTTSAAERLVNAGKIFAANSGNIITSAATAAAAGAASAIDTTSTSGGIAKRNRDLTSGTGLTGFNISGLPVLATGGEFNVPGTGEYPFAAFLHGGEKVSVRPRSEEGDSSNGKNVTINIAMNVSGVSDVDSFRRSETQVLSSLKRRLDAVGRLG